MNSTSEYGMSEPHRSARFSRAYKMYGLVKYTGAAISAVALFGMMIWIVLDIFSRNVLGSSVQGSFEFTQNYFMPLTVFPGLAYVYSSGILPRMNLILTKRTYQVRKVVSLILIAVEILVLVTVIIFSTQYAINGFDRQSAFSAGGEMWPVWPIYIVIPLSLLLVLIEVLFAAMRNILEKTTTIEVNENSTDLQGI